jgi:lambda repressor-like predicted transcriptional regulator
MQYYTYAYLREDRTPYYIGKGEKNRAYVRHWRSKSRGGYFDPPPTDRILILKRFNSEYDAYKHEIYMIAVLGRKDLGTGILRNLTNGGEGMSGVPAWNKGKIGVCPEHQKEINRQMMKKRYENGYSVSGANNPRAKTWRIVFIDGRELVIKSIHDWAKENGYSKASIRNVQIKKWARTKDIISVDIFNDELKSTKQIVSEYKGKISNPNWGKMSHEAKNKLSKERMGTNNKSSKWWKITFDDGRIIERCGLDNWCKENGYDRRSLSRVKNKQYKKHKNIVAVEELAHSLAQEAQNTL